MQRLTLSVRLKDLLLSLSAPFYLTMFGWPSPLSLYVEFYWSTRRPAERGKWCGYNIYIMYVHSRATDVCGLVLVRARNGQVGGWVGGGGGGGGVRGGVRQTECMTFCMDAIRVSVCILGGRGCCVWLVGVCVC